MLHVELAYVMRLHLQRLESAEVLEIQRSLAALVRAQAQQPVREHDEHRAVVARGRHHVLTQHAARVVVHEPARGRSACSSFVFARRGGAAARRRDGRAGRDPVRSGSSRSQRASSRTDATTGPNSARTSVTLSAPHAQRGEGPAGGAVGGRAAGFMRGFRRGLWGGGSRCGARIDGRKQHGAGHDWPVGAQPRDDAAQ